MYGSTGSGSGSATLLLSFNTHLPNLDKIIQTCVQCFISASVILKTIPHVNL
jgi:hypothetical protein